MSYATIVADPPWRMPRRGGYNWRQGRGSGESRELDYPPMALEEIEAIGVEDVAADDAHLWLWTPTRWLEHAPRVARVWGFEPQVTLVWAKPPFGFNPGGTFGITAEFCIFATRGAARSKRKVEQQVFTWSRPLYASGSGKRDGHSTKPEEFYDLVVSVTHGPYLELFQRRGRLGWDGAGDESLATVEIAGVRSG